MIYKVRAYTTELKTPFVYAVEATNGEEAIAATKKRLQRLGFKVKRAYHNFELDGYINAKNELI